jgi:hypothetical protein
LGEISLMMDGGLVPLDKAYETLTTPAKRRKTTIIKRQTSDPKALQQARSLGKELFHEMGPDGEDPLFTFLQSKMKDWQTALAGYKPLADTGNYPGKDQIDDGLGVIKKMLACDGSYKFIDQFNSLKSDLLTLSEEYADLQQFYEHQRPTWEKLHKAFDRLQLNRLELERDAQASPALNRMQEILAAPSPYGLIKEADGLIATTTTINTALITEARQRAAEKINGHFSTLSKDIEAAGGDAGLRSACLKPLESLKSRVQSEDSLAHITQAESEALKKFDAANARIEEFVRKAAEKTPEKGGDPEPPKPVVKKKRVIEPAKLLKTTYLETQSDVDGFLDKLRMELEQAVAQNERIEIR